MMNKQKTKEIFEKSLEGIKMGAPSKSGKAKSFTYQEINDKLIELFNFSLYAR